MHHWKFDAVALLSIRTELPHQENLHTFCGLTRFCDIAKYGFCEIKKNWILRNKKTPGFCEINIFYNILRNERKISGFCQMNQLQPHIVCCRSVKKSGFCEMNRNSNDCILFKISKIVIGPKYNSQVTNYNVCLFHSTIKNGIKGWHILSNILILCQNSLAKPHWKFLVSPGRSFTGTRVSFAFYPNCTDLVQFLLPWTFLCHNINHVALV